MAQTSTYDNVNSSNAPDLVDNATDMTIPPADSSITEMQQEVCNILNADTWMQDHYAHFYPENALDIDFQIRNALDKQGLSCVVMTPKMTFQGHAKNYQGIDKHALAVTIDELLVEIVEQPTINRARHEEHTVVVKDEWEIAGGSGDKEKSDLVGQTFTMGVQTKASSSSVVDLHRECSFFGQASSSFGARNMTLTCQTSDGKDFEIQFNNPPVAQNLAFVYLSSGMRENVDYELIDNNFYVFKKPITVISADMRDTGDKIVITNVEHEYEERTEILTAATALDVAIKAANLLCGLDTDTKNVFNNPRIEQGEANNLLTCQLRTSCTILLD